MARPPRTHPLAKGPAILLDVAHNPAGAWTLRAAIAQLPESQPRTLLFSCLRDKNLAEMSQILFPLFDSSADRPTTTSSSPPSTTPAPPAVDDLLAAARALDIPAQAAPDIAAALEQARALTPPDGLIIATGSIYLVGEIRRLAGKDERLPMADNSTQPNTCQLCQAKPTAEGILSVSEPDVPAPSPTPDSLHLPSAGSPICFWCHCRPGHRLLRQHLSPLRPVGQVRPPAALHRPLWARTLLLISMSPVKVIGREKLHIHETAVYASNHLSYMDTPVLFAWLPFQFRILAKQSLWKVPSSAGTSTAPARCPSIPISPRSAHRQPQPRRRHPQTRHAARPLPRRRPRRQRPDCNP